MSKEINKTNALDILLSAGNECEVPSQNDTAEIDNTIEKSFKDDNAILDYMVQYITNRLGIEKIAYKGGYIFNKLLPELRKTYDVDLDIGTKELYKDIKIVLKEIGEHFLSGGIINKYVIKDSITDELSGGVKYYRERDKKLGVDIGCRDLSFGITKLELDFGDINSYMIERSLVDKLSAICSVRRFRRTKDLFDAFMFIKMFPIDGDLLTTCLTKQPIDYNEAPVSIEVITKLGHAYSKLTLGSEYSYRSDKPNFDELMNKLIIFIETTKNCSNKVWDNNLGKWVDK